MDEINGKAEALNTAIRSSSLYQQYLQAKQKLMTSPEKYVKFTDFNKTHLDFQARRFRGEMQTFDEEKYIASLYAELFLCDDTRAFIEARNQLMALISSTQDIVYKDIILD